jgi:hypothetical protein
VLKTLKTKLKIELKNSFREEMNKYEMFSEQFFLFLCANMFMIKKYDFISTLFKRCGLDLELFMILPVSKTFIGDILRLWALCDLYSAKKLREEKEEG